MIPSEAFSATDSTVAAATWDICEFLLDLHEQGRLDTGFGRLDATLPYHAPCQLRGHGIGLPALDLFALVPGLDAIDLDHEAIARSACPGRLKGTGPGGPTQLLVIELDATGGSGDLELDRDSGRSLEPDVVRTTDQPDRDDAGRPAEGEPELVDPAVELERAEVD